MLRSIWRASALAILTMVAGCAAQAPKPNPYTGFYKNFSTCREEYAQMDARVEAAGVRDAGFWRVPGYSYLRTDRLHATFGPQVHGLNDVSEWITRMRELDQNARDYEYINLGMTDLEVSLQRDRFLNCGRILASIDLEVPGAWDKLVATAYPQDDYSSMARVLGLHALRGPDIRARQSALRDRLLKSHRETLSTEGPLQLWTVQPVEDLALLEGAERTMQFNALGYPNLFGSQWLALVEVNAPALWIEGGGESDLPAAPKWTAEGLSADVTRPVVNYQVGYTRFGTQMLVQITYSIWFRAPPGSRYTPIDGLSWRVTLDPHLKPLVYESLHPSGSDHRWYPVQALTRRTDGDADVVFIAQDFAPARRPVLRLAAGTHRLRRVLARSDAVSSGERAFALRPYEDLYTLPRPGGGSRSLFGPDGFVVGSQGRDDLAGWSSGIARPGVLRQAGHHAIALVERRHFDDPTLLDATFVAPEGEPAPVRVSNADIP